MDSSLISSRVCMSHIPSWAWLVGASRIAVNAINAIEKIRFIDRVLNLYYFSVSGFSTQSTVLINCSMRE